MDGELKTLDQLSGSPANRKYITLDTGSQISGYTKDYLERLCRLDKVDCGEWTRGKGQFVVELNSLLRETHTLLISHEGLLFVDKREIKFPEGCPAASVAVPPPALSSLPPTTPTLVKMPPSPPPPPAMVFQAPPSPAQTSGAVSAGKPDQNLFAPQPKPIFAPPSPVAPPVPVTPPQSFVGQAPAPLKPSSPLPISTYTDEWDKLLFSGVNDIPQEPEKPKEVIAPSSSHAQILSEKSSQSSVTPPQSVPPPPSIVPQQNLGGQVYPAAPRSVPPYGIATGVVPFKADTTGVPPLFDAPSTYRPIQTSVDASLHFDPAPLFPPLQKPEVRIPSPAQTSEEVLAGKPAQIFPQQPKPPVVSPPLVAPPTFLTTQNSAVQAPKPTLTPPPPSALPTQVPPATIFAPSGTTVAPAPHPVFQAPVTAPVPPSSVIPTTVKIPMTTNRMPPPAPTLPITPPSSPEPSATERGQATPRFSPQILAQIPPVVPMKSPASLPKTAVTVSRTSPPPQAIIDNFAKDILEQKNPPQ